MDDDQPAPPVALPSEKEMDEIEPAPPVHVITPDDSVASVQGASESPKVKADDYEAIMSTFMPPLPDLETLEESVSTWDITSWREMARREHGPVFECAGFPWRVLFFPWGNGVECASFYLEHGYSEENPPPPDWYACVQFLLVLWNPNDPSIFIQHTASHRFTAEEGDWGFTRFVELRRIFNLPWEGFERPMVENNAVKLTAYVRVVKDPTGVLWHSFLNYDSKKETGMVGLKNQGATCYLNSLLQSLYLTPAFRKAVYQIPTNVETSPKTNHAYALQRLFLQLQISENAVATNELTASFGWETRQIFEQQDVQELSRLLMERLEEKMKGTEAENALAKIFMGQYKTYIDCINVDYQSSKREDFWDLQLNVTNMAGLDESFQDYCKVQLMDGDNKYQAEGYGLQDAKMGVNFPRLPSVLHLQLKRFEYDYAREQQLKINDRFEFPETWDATPYLSEDADRSEPYIYKLHGVLVHAGELHAGHYYAFLKPGRDGYFYKFDDDRVTRATLKEALDDNFGGEYPMQNGVPGQRAAAKPHKRSTNAYMLVYIRECHYDKILLSNEVVEPPAPIVKKWEEERALYERRKKERDEAHLYTEVSVATTHNFRHYEGFDIVPFTRMELVDEKAYPKAYRVKKKMLIDEFVELVTKDMGVPPHLVRPWCMVGRQNGTIRPDLPLNAPEMTIEEASIRYGHKQVLRIWMEEASSVSADGTPMFGDTQVELQKNGDKPILLFLKYFNIESQTLYGVGSFYASNGDKVSDLSAYILKLLGWPQATNYRVFEEIKQGMIDPMKPKSTLSQAELQDGDIITVQKALSEKEQEALKGKFSDVREYYDYLQHRVCVRFEPKNGEDEKTPRFDLTLNKRLNYTQLSQKVGEHLEVDPTHIRFSPINVANGKAKAPIKYSTGYNLGQILSQGYSMYGTPSQRSDSLFYEVLECSMQELENRKFVKVAFLPETDAHDKEEHLELLVPKNGTVTDLIVQIQKKTGISDDIASRIRVYEAHNKKIHKDFTLTYPVTNFNEFTDVIAEPRLIEELEPAENEKLVNCFHFDRDIAKAYGYPFVFLAKENEPFSETKERLGNRIGIKGKNLEKVKFCIVPRSGYGKAEPLEDEDIIYQKMATDDMLGINHPNKNRTTTGRNDNIFIR